MNLGKVFPINLMISGSFLAILRSISIRLYRPVAAVKKGSRRDKRSRIILGAPLSDNKPERITFESRKILTVFFAINVFVKGSSFLFQADQQLFD